MYPIIGREVAYQFVLSVFFLNDARCSVGYGPRRTEGVSENVGAPLW